MKAIKKVGKVLLIILGMIVLGVGGFLVGRSLFPGQDKTIVTAPGEVIDYETVFVQYAGINNVFTKHGHFERVNYTTDVYEDSVTYEKYCKVYLPAGYDPNDNETKYDVLYFQHGNTGDPDMFDHLTMRTMLDNLFATGKIKPMILVFTTYYFDVTTDVNTRRSTGAVPAGDGNWDGIPGNFYREVVEDIIPAVESRYNTYTESTDSEGIKASRDHRGFSGYSRGGVTTWTMFHYNLEYFKWFAPMSCHCTAGLPIMSNELTAEAAYSYLKEAIDAHPDLDFFIYAASGGENDAPMLREQMRYFTNQTDVFLYGTDPTVNNIYYSISEFRHSDRFVPYYYYNSLQVLFRN